jgi:hypothetical protein
MTLTRGHVRMFAKWSQIRFAGYVGSIPVDLFCIVLMHCTCNRIAQYGHLRNRITINGTALGALRHLTIDSQVLTRWSRLLFLFDFVIHLICRMFLVFY